MLNYLSTLNVSIFFILNRHQGNDNMLYIFWDRTQFKIETKKSENDYRW